MSSMPQDFDFFYFLSFFVFWFLLKSYHVIVSHCPDIDFSHWFKIDVHWIIEKLFWFKRLRHFLTFFSHSFNEILNFACICNCFQNHKTYCDLLMMIYNFLVSPSRYSSAFVLISVERF